MSSSPWPSTLVVEGLHVYPLKSGAALVRDEVHIGPLGLDGDRLMMVVDAGGHFVTQRAHPRMAVIAARRDGDRVVVTAPGREPIVAAWIGSSRTRVEVWGEWVDGLVLDPALDAWMAAYLGLDARVVRFPDDAVREADPDYAAPGDRVAYADGFAILVAGTASLDALNAALEARGERRVPMDRFRPNLVVATEEPWIEDRWRRIRVGSVELAVVKPCGRCVMVNVDQATGAAGREPLRTLASFRTQGTSAGGQRVVFGQNATPRGVGVVRLGDPVEVLETA